MPEPLLNPPTHFKNVERINVNYTVLCVCVYYICVCVFRILWKCVLNLCLSKCTLISLCVETEHYIIFKDFLSSQ